MLSQKYATGTSICIWFDHKMKLWVYLVTVVIFTALLYFLAIVSATSKGIDIKFLA